MTWQQISARTARALLCIIGLIALCSVPAMAATITVCSSGCNYTSIQAAIDHAVDGDTIAVMNGTYYESITIDKPLLLQGESPEGTIINGSYSGTVVNITADDVVFTNFSVTGGGKTDFTDWPAGIGLDGTSNDTISRCRIADCDYIGLFANNTTGLTISENEIFNNNWTGIETITSDLARISSNFVHDNEKGLLCSGTTRLQCSDNVLSHNIFNGLYMDNGLSDSVIKDNLIQDNCYTDFTGAGDDSQAGGYIEFIENCSIRNNQFVHNGGIALFLSGMDSSVLEGNVMEDNYAGFSYNGISPNPDNSIDTSNTVDGIPVLYVEGADHQVITGEGIATLYCVSCDDVVIRDLVLTQRNGFGIYVFGGSGISAQNNTVANNVFQDILFASVEDAAMTGNIVENATIGSGVLSSVNVTVMGNTATGNDKGLAAAGDISDVHFSGNTLRENGVGFSFEYASGDDTDCTGNEIRGAGSGYMDVGISFLESREIGADRNTISGCYEGIWITGGDSHTISNTSIDACKYGIEVSPFGGAGTPKPSWGHRIIGNAVHAQKIAFFTSGLPEFVYGTTVFLNNFVTDTEPPLSSDYENLGMAAGSPLSWGLSRSAALSSAAAGPATAEVEPNVFNTDTPVTYRYQGIYFTGYLGNYWNWYNGTDVGGNGVGTTPYPVIMNNTDEYPLIAPVSTYNVGPTPSFYANFTASPVRGAAPLTVQFTDMSDGSPVLWLYKFGDGFSSTGKNPRYTYRTPGNYTVSLTVWRMEGQKLVSTTTRKPAFIRATGSPVPALAANFTAVPLSGPVPLAVTFTDSSTGSPEFWNYDFGDGSTSPAKNPVHTYRAAGTYTVTLTVMKMGGEGLIRNTVVKQGLVNVTGIPVPALAANFTAVPLSGPAPLAVTFTDTSTGSPDYWSYDFGDGTTSPAKNPVHTYGSAGTYTVSLTVMKVAGNGLIRNTTVKQNLISVSGSPVPVLAANFTAAPLSGPVPLKVTFTDTSTGNPDYWNYDFGDGTTSPARNPDHTYLSAGTYTVSLTVLKVGVDGLIRNTTTRQNLITAG